MKCRCFCFPAAEPFIRKDIFELGKLAADKGLRPVISSNGTLIDRDMARKVKEAGFQYVGISLDGAPATNVDFRNMPGAF
jgi:MoaA/NifB/PqqE/SkfB family radical SAM enzyme